jgi:signal transduction histidine kinase
VPGELDRIFERFYKADPSRRAGSSGLGLAIAAENAALLGGRLHATNRPEGGLRIELHLPVTGSLPRGDLPAIGSGDGGTPIATTQEPRP